MAKSSTRPKAKSSSTTRSARGSAARTGKTAQAARRPAKKSAPARKSSRRSAPKQPAAQLPRLPAISPERRLDIVGMVLALAGLLTALLLLSPTRSQPAGWWIGGLRQLAGWGTFVLPVAAMAVGLWLVFRHIEKLPVPSAQRILGVMLIYLNILAWGHLMVGGGIEPAREGIGGGLLGHWLSLVLLQGLGLAGALVVLAAWLLIGLALAFDVSVPELFDGLRAAFTPLFARLRRPARTAPPEELDAVEPVLPGGFRPMRSAATTQPAPLPTQPVLPSAAPTTSTATLPTREQPAERAPAPAAAAPARTPAVELPRWKLPSVDDILDLPTTQAVQINQDKERANLIEETLASFGAPAHVVEIHRGPTVTQFGVEPDFVENRSGRTRVRVSKIAALADDLALALAAPRIRIQAPVPGRSYVGIEVANPEPSKVLMREVYESAAFKRVKSHLKFTLGKDVAGGPVVADLTAMPHLLIAGTTGSGKSVCVNSVLCSLLLTNTPNELRLVLVDPKRVELTGYNGIPHLLDRVVTDAEKVVGALQWMQREMDARYHRFSQAGARNIQEYNAQHSPPLPYLVTVIDELADLMMLAPDETERAITRLAQLARATGIHLILATQRPSVDVVTGLIKANFPARIAFAVASGTDSRVILDQPGAERLLGRGDMLFQAPDAAAPVRLQGVYVSDPEIQRLVDYWRTAAALKKVDIQPTAVDEPIGQAASSLPLRQADLWDQGAEANGDPLFKEAVELVRREGKASITMLQRKMRIGYTRAARLVDAMEARQIIGPPVSGSQLREVLAASDPPQVDDEEEADDLRS